jgi:hypothetical protein
LIKHRDGLTLAGTVVVFFENVPGNPQHPNGQPGVVGVTQGRRGRDRVANPMRSKALPEALPARKSDPLTAPDQLLTGPLVLLARRGQNQRSIQFDD